LKKVCYNVYLCENGQQQSCKAFNGLSIRAKMFGGGGLLLLDNLADTDTFFRLLPTSVTSNDLGRHNSPYFA